MESILSLILSVQSQIDQIVDSLPDLLLKKISDKNPNTRKICVDTLYTLCAIEHDLMMDYHEKIYDVLQNFKTDPHKPVREAVMECLKVVTPFKK